MKVSRSFRHNIFKEKFLTDFSREHLHSALQFRRAAMVRHPPNELKGNAMKLHISSKGRTVSKRVRNFVTERVEKATQRFSNRINRVDVSMVNSSGATEPECRVVFSVNGSNSIVATAHADNLLAAISQAIDRARRGLSRNIDRRRSKRSSAPAM